jgi:uncharacterized membrane protein (DUF106 family)
MLMDKKVVDRLQNLIRLDEESQHVEIAKNYSLAVAAATTIVLLSALTLAFFGYISIFIFFFPFTVLSAWYSGRNCGITTALLSGLFFILYFFVLTHPAVPNWVLPIILILTVEGVFISILMYFSKNSEELQKLQDENKE